MTELRNALAQMSKNAPRELAKANARVARIAVAEAKRRAPKGPHQGGGRDPQIAQHIQAVVSGSTVSITATAVDAAAYEFGGMIARRGFKGRGRTAKRFARTYGGKTVTRITAQPFMYPAVEAKLDEIVQAYETMLLTQIAQFERA